MTGAVLMVTRHTKLHPHYKKRMEYLGFKNVTITDADKDGLNFIINDIKPCLVMIGAGFYQGSTPYMMALLLNTFPDLNIAAVTLGEYPADRAMRFITNGVNSFITALDGADQFYDGLEKIRKGNTFISASVQERIDLRSELPPPAKKITDRQTEVLRLMCCGLSIDETADLLHISSRTVDAHRRDIYFILNARTDIEVLKTALKLKLVNLDELNFYGRKYTLKPRPDKKLITQGGI